MAKKRTSAAMETQPLTVWRNAPTPMADCPSKRLKHARLSQAAVPRAEAEATRRGSLKKQRSQMDAVKGRKA